MSTLLNNSLKLIFGYQDEQGTQDLITELKNQFNTDDYEKVRKLAVAEIVKMDSEHFVNVLKVNSIYLATRKQLFLAYFILSSYPGLPKEINSEQFNKFIKKQ
jgi:hypothetical protein